MFLTRKFRILGVEGRNEFAYGEVKDPKDDRSKLIENLSKQYVLKLKYYLAEQTTPGGITFLSRYKLCWQVCDILFKSLPCIQLDFYSSHTVQSAFEIRSSLR